jgi:hypothetical protein
MKKINISKTETFARFVHVVAPKEGEPRRIQAVSENGKLVTARCSEAIFKRVLGERRGEKGERFHLGLRQLTHVQFRAHYDDKDIIQALDIIPNRMFVSGAAPRAAGDAMKKGFDIHIDDDLNGFDVWSEDSNSGEKLRVAYAGLSERELCELLDDLRDCTWGSKRTQTLGKHRFEKVEEGVIRCRPVENVHYTT